MNPTIITASTAMELSLLIEALSAAPLTGALGRAPLQAFRGRCGERDIILALTGIGKVNAASVTAMLLERCRPQLLINTGCGGAFAGSGLSVVALSLTNRECFPDEGVETPQGWQGLELIGIPLFRGRGERFFNQIPVAGALAQAALAFAREHGFRAELGPF